MSDSVEIEEDLSFPDEWQSYNCPPSDSVSPNEEYPFYRAVENKPAIASDFLNAVEEGKYKKASMCDRLSISLLNSEEGAHHHLELFPWKSHFHIAKLRLNSSHGKVKDTPTNKQPDHADWWPYRSVVRENTVIGYLV